MKSLIASASILALCATAPAIAKSGGMDGPMRSAGTISAYMNGGDIRTSKWIGQPIRNKGGKTIGDVNDFILTNDGKLRALVAGVGGFLGIGEKQVLIPFSKMQVKGNGSKAELVAFLSKEELEAAPDYGITGTRADNSAGEAVRTGKEAISETVKAAESTVSEAAETAQEKAAEASETVKETATEAAEETKDAASEAASEARETAGEAKEAAGEGAEGAKDAAGSAYELAKEAVSETVESVSETAREAYDEVKDAVTGKETKVAE